MAAVGVATVVLVYVVRLFGLGVDNYRAAGTRDRLAAEVTALSQDAVDLGTAAADAQTDAAVERWARRRSWAQPGDYPVVVVAPTGSPTAAPSPTAPPRRDPWDRLRRWLKGR